MKKPLVWIALALAALVFVGTHFVWLAEMPERMATHFDGAGKANGWMTRREHGAFMLIFGLGSPAFVLGLCWAIRLLPSTLLNVPKPYHWRAPENYPQACDIIYTWAQWFTVGMFGWMTFLNYQIVQANRSTPPRFDSEGTLWLSGLFIAFTAATMVWLYRRFLKTNQACPSKMPSK